MTVSARRRLPSSAPVLLVPALGLLLLFVPLLLVASCRAAGAQPARRDSFTALGDGLRDRDATAVELTGYMRTRFAALHNLDMDRGVTPSGAPLFAVPAGDPTGQRLGRADMRLRTDLSIFAPRGGVVVRVRADMLDNLRLGSQALGAPTASVSQDTQNGLSNAIALRRAWAEVALPFGVFAAGRMGNWWGLGMLGNGGECLDCDTADAVDRAVLATPLFGHILAVAYDFSASGAAAKTASAVGSVDAEPADDVRSVSIAWIRYASELTRARRSAAGLLTLDYGALFSRRWQDLDDPATWLNGAGQGGGRTFMARGFVATAFDVWARLVGRSFRVELELAALTGRYDQPSPLPGVLYRDPLESLQLGGALQARFGGVSGLYGGVDLGLASGDPAPGMGYHQPLQGGLPAAGDLQGAQADPPRDVRIDNFRFHADMRPDRILFREVIGGVTDAMYARPLIGWHDPAFGAGALTVELAAVASRALYASSTPGDDTALGLEIDPTLTYLSRDGFRLQLQYAALLPGAGFDNLLTGQTARASQLVRLHLAWLFS